MAGVGRQTTYELTVGVIVDIEDMISSLDPYDIPLVGQYAADGRSAITKGTCFEKKVEWLDETILTPRSTLSGAITNVATTLDIQAVDAFKFGIGDVIAIENEKIRVTAIDAAGDTLTVTRAFAGTTGASHADLKDVIGVGMALPEGSDPEAARYTDRTGRYNYTEIFGPHKVEVSETENVVRKYGLKGTTEFDHQAGNRTKEVGVGIEQAILYGTRFEDTGNKWRTMGGFTEFMTSNVDSSTTTMTDTAIGDLLQTIYAAGGNPDRMVVGPKQKRVISGFNDDIIRLTRADNGRGSQVDFFEGDFSRISILLNRWVRVSDAFLFTRDQVELCTLRPLNFKMLGETGDSRKGQIVGEKTLKFRRSRHAGRFSALT